MRAAALIAIVGAVLGLASFAQTGERSEAQRGELDSYCSPTGDYCLAIQAQKGRVKLQIVSQAFKGRYTLCVKGPESRECHEFTLEDIGSSYADSIDWERRFGAQGDGTYLVKWKLGGTILGKTLGFQLG